MPAARDSSTPSTVALVFPIPIPMAMPVGVLKVKQETITIIRTPYQCLKNKKTLPIRSFASIRQTPKAMPSKI